MTQYEKDLLSKDLCARLPYGVKVHFSGWDSEYLQQKEMVDTLYSIDSDGYCNTYEYDSLLELGNIKPYLFPISSMTDELWDKEFMGCGITEFTRDSFKYGCETLEFNNSNPHLSSMIRFINQLIKNHFDIYGLIPMGLAEDATGLNIY